MSSHAELSSPHSGALMHDVHDIPARRLRHQQIAGPAGADAADVVRAFGAMQAQDYRNALWAVGLRTLHATEASIERAVAEREIVRTWPMRGTLHFLAAADVHWRCPGSASGQRSSAAY